MLIVAHRGYSAAYPENTALAFERAIEAGADFIETDVRVTRERALVCSHDPDLKRVAGDARPIAEMTLEEIKAMPLGRSTAVHPSTPLSLRSGRTEQERTAESKPSGRTEVLTLDEVLEIARGRVRVMLDVKVTTPEMVEAIASCLERTAMVAQVVYGARSVEHMRGVAGRCPGVAILGMPKAPALAPEFLAHPLRAIRYWEDEVTPERVTLVTRAGREVWVTAGLRPRQEAPGYITAARASALAAGGVHALLVNDPTIGR